MRKTTPAKVRVKRVHEPKIGADVSKTNPPMTAWKLCTKVQGCFRLPEVLLLAFS